MWVQKSDNTCARKTLYLESWYSMCAWKNGEYLGSIIDDSVITCDEIIEPAKTIPIHFNNKQVTTNMTAPL